MAHAIMPVYKAEVQAGLADAIRAQASVAYQSPLLTTEPSELLKALAQARAQKEIFKAEATNEGQIDLHYLKSIMVTVGKNLNDDIFDKQETWIARYTPEDKPFNLEHDPNRIRGHITGTYVTNEAGEVLSDNLAIDELPDKYHIVSSAVLYKFLKCADPKLEEEMKQVIAEINEGKWFVSMEALFANFDYGVTSANGDMTIIPRNEESAFLTKHLRAYGGSGKYEDHSIGRVLRNIVFSGKGLVLKPANPESIIFRDVAAFKGTVASMPKEFHHLQTDAGYKTVRDNATHGTQQESNRMATEITQAQVEVLQEQIKSLQASVTTSQKKNEEYEQRLKDMNEKQVQAKIDEITNQAKAKDERIAALDAQVKTEQTARTEAEAKLKTVTEKVTTLEAEFTKVKADQTRATRITQWVERTGVETAVATKSVEKLMKLDDAEFKDFLETQPAKATTPPPPEPKVEPTKASETVDAGKVIDKGQADQKTAPLHGDGVDVGVEQTRANLANFIGTNFLGRKKKKAETVAN